jgi:hypothetical protein
VADQRIDSYDTRTTTETAMSVTKRLLGFGVALVLSGAAAEAHVYEVYQGNDTGGIISWSCENEALARDIAAAHCARFGKFHRITGVHRQYGDFISFNCLWNPRIARFAIPAVRTRATCRARAHPPPVRVKY